MAEEAKKISFGFAKSIKKTVLKNAVPQEKKKVDYIECLDEKSIKVIGEEEKKDEPLVIPLLGSKTWHDRIVNKIDADIFEPKVVKNEAEENGIKVKEEKPEVSNGNATPVNSVPPIKIKTEPPDNDNNTVSTLEEQAAKEIIEELKSSDNQEKEKVTLTLPIAEDQTLRGQEESTLDDYEKIPVDSFGLAMLRGMGWQPGKGIGKNEKIVAAVVPELRPKGMGLGADKVTLQKQVANSKKESEELKIEKGSFVKIIAGKQSDNYGQIEGFDDDAGRLIVKMALGGNIISLNEFMVQPVTKSEYSKNSKVLNAKKYEEYKNKESDKKVLKKRKPSSSEHSESSGNDTSNEENSRKKDTKSSKDKKSRSNEGRSRGRKRHSSDQDSDSDYGKKVRRQSRSSSSDTYKSKKVKKSKKHRRQDSSSERSSKKHKKKDKEREKSRNKKSKDSEYMERRKRKKHKRSRSRSSSRR